MENAWRIWERRGSSTFFGDPDPFYRRTRPRIPPREETGDDKEESVIREDEPLRNPDLSFVLPCRNNTPHVLQRVHFRT